MKTMKTLIPSLMVSAILLGAPASLRGERVTLKLTLVPVSPNTQLTMDDFLDLWRESSASADRVPPQPDEFQLQPLTYNFDETFNVGTVTLDVRLGRSTMPELVTSVTQTLRTFAQSDAALTTEQRMQRLGEVDGLIKQTRTRIDLMQGLRLANLAANSEQRPTRRIPQLHAERHRLETELRAKQARMEALQLGIDRQRAQAEQQRRDDPVAQELQKLIEAREKEVKVLVGSGASSRDIAQAEASLAEARIRLLERQEGSNNAAMGELMDRMASELAMLSVDTAELHIKLQRVRDELKPFDPATITPENVEELTRVSAGPRSADVLNAQISALYDQLNKLRKERPALLVEDVKVELVPLPATQAQP